MLQGVVFDLDGTLLDTEKLYRRFWVEAARQMGYPMEDRHALMVRSMAAERAEPLLRREVCKDFDYHGKPAPDVYLLAAQKLELPPRVLLGVEDSPSGVQSAHAAGMMVAMVPDQDQPSAEIAALCALVAPSLAGIAPFVKESLRRL